MLPKRREARLPVSLSVRILGIDANGKAFHQAATTIDVSDVRRAGHRIDGEAEPRRYCRPAERRQKSADSKWPGSRSNGDGTYQVGLHCLEKGTSPWREKMKQAVNGRPPRRMTAIPSTARSRCIRQPLATPIWGTLRDISAGGCYVQCVNVAAKGEIVSGQFILNGVQINAVAEVRSSRPTVGMGLQWCDLGWDGQEKLNNILRALALNYTRNQLQQNQGAGTTGKASSTRGGVCANGWKATTPWWMCR